MSDAPFSGNRGEWSGLYALFRLLADGELWLGDSEGGRLHDGRRVVTAVTRCGRGGAVCHRIEDGEVVSRSEAGQVIARVARSRCQSVSEHLLTLIRQGGNSSLCCPDAEALAHDLGAASLKTATSRKLDLEIEMTDPRSGVAERIGFCVKSDLGSRPTLLNASGATNFVYALTPSGSISDTHSAEVEVGLRETLMSLARGGLRLDFRHIASLDFALNLQVVDSRLPEICAEMVREYYVAGVSALSDSVESLERRNPLGFDQSRGHRFYEYKVKQMLRDIAMGMRPAASIWRGRYEAGAGYVRVGKDGQLLAFSVYDPEAFQDYLLRGTRFDTPSLRRHDAGVVYQLGGEDRINLPMQIRFL